MKNCLMDMTDKMMRCQMKRPFVEYNLYDYDFQLMSHLNTLTTQLDIDHLLMRLGSGYKPSPSGLNCL